MLLEPVHSTFSVPYYTLITSMKILIGVLFFFFNYIKMWQLKFDNIFFTKTLLFVYQVYVNRKNHF